jgi:hypothetical protein
MRNVCILGVLLLIACSGGPTDPTKTPTPPIVAVGTMTAPARDGHLMPPIDPSAPNDLTTPTPDLTPPTTPPDLTLPPTPADLAPPSRPTGPGTHTRCGWINTPDGYTVFQQRTAEFEAIHPKWHVMLADGVNLRNAGQTNDAAPRTSPS